MVTCTVMGPIREPVASFFGFLGGTKRKTAVIEMAAAAGLRLVPHNRRNPLHTTTYGVGQLIKFALDQGAEEIVLGCGDSGTCDGGVGMAQALGAKFHASDGQEISSGSGGGHLQTLASVDLSQIDRRLWNLSLKVACNWHNVLCGARGVARVFGPQKGASAGDVMKLEVAMSNVARVVNGCITQDIALLPGSGASGGLGAGLLLIGGELHPRFDVVAEFFNIDDLLHGCDLVITAEGGIDDQTPQGKVPSYVASQAGAHGVSVIALAGTIGDGARINYGSGIDAYASILQSPTTLQKAIAEAPRLLEDAAESMMRMVLTGWNMCQSIKSRSGTSSRSSSCVSHQE